MTKLKNSNCDKTRKKKTKIETKNQELKRAQGLGKYKLSSDYWEHQTFGYDLDSVKDV